MTEHCETCVHFDRHEPDQARFGAPDGVEGDELLRWGNCRFVIDTNNAREEPHSERAYPQDASGYRAWLMVREDFGCIDHQSTEDQ